MQCSSCGAFYQTRSMKCLECGATRNKDSVEPTQRSQPDSTTIMQEAASPETTKMRAKTTSSLIEFPGLNRNSKPQWRKELGERVREVQERRAREAALEAGEASGETDEDGSKPLSLLELLPQAEIPPMNPLVAAALRRIERAHVPTHYGNNAIATAVAYEEKPELEEDLAYSTNVPSVTPIPIGATLQNTPPPSERVHNLAVVPNSVINAAEITKTPKPRRLIGGDPNDPALNYLDAIPTAAIVDNRGYNSASLFRRVFTAMVDMAVVCVLATPFVALVKLTDLQWQDLRVITFAVATWLVMGFLYQTISTAMTGRTLGMRLLSLRVVDARTGLIPTGGQSAGRALVYVLSLACAGVALIYALIDSDKHTAHDRLTRTAVIRV